MDGSLAQDGAAGMLSLSPATRIFVALEPVDLRQSFNGLSARVASVLAQDPCSGHLFLFTNRSHNRIKVLYRARRSMARIDRLWEHGYSGRSAAAISQCASASQVGSSSIPSKLTSLCFRRRDRRKIGRETENRHSVKTAALGSAFLLLGFVAAKHLSDLPRTVGLQQRVIQQVFRNRFGFVLCRFSKGRDPFVTEFSKPFPPPGRVSQNLSPLV